MSVATDELFDRTIDVTIGKSVRDGFFVQTDTIRISKLRVSFVVTKTIGSKPNTLTGTIYNLSEASRALVQRDAVITLDAGYGGELRRLFQGDITWAPSTRRGVDWMTDLTAGDGHRAHNHARVNRSYGKGVQVRQLIKEAAKSMGLKVPKSIDDAKELIAEYQGGYAMNGRASSEMDKILRGRGFDWSVQDGTLQVLKTDALRADEAYVISQATGMIDVPDFGAPSARGKKPTLKVKTLLYPAILPGSRVQLETRSIRGLFKATKIVHTVDTGGPVWQTEIEAVPV